MDLAFLKVEGGKLKPLTAADPASLKAGALAAVVGLTIDAGSVSESWNFRCSWRDSAHLARWHSGPVFPAGCKSLPFAIRRGRG